ncbi:MFS transporter [Ferrovibrio xuzhouensis]|uniref:MFS transporter n=1 Tax=Ferrovibrio xuzhouensis TaxID=1576914 RepID=A0ABV7VHU3_9PROT
MSKPLATPQDQTAQIQEGLPQPRRAAAVACVLGALVLVVLDAAIANVALPTISQSLQVSSAESVRVVTAYQLAIVMALLPCAALGERLGYRRVYMTGIALFTGASALCTFAPTLDWLVAARFIQGFGAACIMPLSVALLRFTVPHHRLGMAIGWNALAVALSSAAGPTIGALILSGASWHWLFAVNLPLGAVLLLAGRALPYVAGMARRIDLVSVLLNAGAFACFFGGAELIPTSRILAVTGFAAAAIFFTALVIRESPKPAPLFPLDLLRTGSFRNSVIASVNCFSGQTIAMVALPFYLQHNLGLSALMTGLLITPWPLAVAIAAPLSARIANTVSTGILCAAGGICLAVGLAGVALWPLHGSPLPLIPFIILCGAGFGFFQTPNNRNMFLSAPRERSGAAGGMQGTARLTGQTAGAVIMSLLLALAPLDMAPRLGFGVAAVLAMTAGLVSLLRIRPKAPA